MMKHIEVPYGDNFVGDLFLPQGNMPHPCLILFHAWMGKDAFALKKAEELVETLGIAIFCADYYGGGKSVKTKEEAQKLVEPLAKDPKELRRRATLALEAALQQELVKTSSVGAIGFCFGGHAVLELYRSGAPLKGACAIHPVISNENVKSLPMASDIKGKLLVLLGYLDPLINKNDLHTFEEDLKKSKVDWQINTYGLAAHAFTNPDAHDHDLGLIYDSNISTRAFAAMSNFFLAIL